MPPMVRGSDSTSTALIVIGEAANINHAPPSDAPMGKGFPGPGTSPRLCLRILGWVVFEHEATGDVLSF